MDDRPRFKCKRCGRLTILRKEGQEYGRKCAKKLAGQVQLDIQALVSGIVAYSPSYGSYCRWYPDPSGSSQVQNDK